LNKRYSVVEVFEGIDMEWITIGVLVYDAAVLAFLAIAVVGSYRGVKAERRA
jgi:hypothetical protein